ncbi:hypothetical protein SAT01_28690 [Sinomonas atrocyanea]|uniref:aldehyde dehydrogenase family protein n=1 Tax=Sinomonas atrocyanea TaxID=37927 RepID=UPI000A6EC322|nr:aldehyde dehydrogenase family protein [Sinomonas atrocyanea]GEB65421.1 hypothetical protein SAT01_28690 [Sinomonas atrocyanea]GGG65990.1 hypothetical protein GCM10007172_16900 [Sinomonas atrocyanea]
MRAQPAWAALPAPARGAVLLKAATLLEERAGQVAADLVREEGKTLVEAGGEVKRAADVLRFFGSLGWAPSGDVLPSGAPATRSPRGGRRRARSRSSPRRHQPLCRPILDQGGRWVRHDGREYSSNNLSHRDTRQNYS